MSNAIPSDQGADSAIAVIGLAGRFPQAPSINEFWANLRDGVEAISFFDVEDVDAGVDPALVAHPSFVRAGGVLEGIDLFDAAFFGFSPREAEIMDPQQRAFLEVAWTALEQAGYTSEGYEGAIGVYAGVSPGTYLMNNLINNPALAETVQPFQLKLSNDKDFLATITSYKLNLHGPSVVVQTACSTSLTAVCMACQSLLTYQCDMALAGGASIKVPHKAGYLYQPGGILSPDGHCKAFDAAAGGSVDGNGVGIVVLKRLEEALADGDTIYAVIKGTAINNDGSTKVNYAAPSVDGQAEVIAMAQAVAGVEAETISYVETHGAGTLLGDPIEIAALTQAFRSSTEAKGFCAIGSVKSNIGHLDTAAGIAGLIKTVLALKHRQIPPSLHFTRPNPQIDFENSPFYVNTRLKAWDTDQLPRRAGVSSFGIGGTNAHVILEEAPEPHAADAGEQPASHQPWQLLVLSAKTASALHAASERLAAYLRDEPQADLADVAYTLQVGRHAFSHRQIVVCRDTADAIAALEARNPERVMQAESETRDWPITFMFAGLGDHYVNMGLSLYQTQPVFRDAIDQCAELLEPELGLDLRSVLYPQGTEHQSDSTQIKPGSSSSQRYDLRQMFSRDAQQPDHSAEPFNQTALAQPILFVLEYALAQQWMDWGIRPTALIGHSLGEYVAATLAGVFELEDALLVVARRARMIQALPSGAMLTVLLSEQALQPYLNPQLSLAAVNGPKVCVVSGTSAAITALERTLFEQGVACRPLPTAHAFHSHMMEPILDAFTKVVQGITLHPPETPYISNISGTWITAAQATDPRYWARHLRQTVRFADGVRTLWAEPDRILLEVGPGQSLSSMAYQQPQNGQPKERLALPTLRTAKDPTPDRVVMLNTLSKLWLRGVPVDWESLHATQRRQRLPLPTYPFERKPYWIASQRAAYRTDEHSVLANTHTASSDRLTASLWKQSLYPPRQQTAEHQCWLIVGGDDDLSDALSGQLEAAGHVAVRVSAGQHFRQRDERTFMIAPQEQEDYQRLVETLRMLDLKPRQIVHLWTMTAGKRQSEAPASDTDRGLNGADSLIGLARALGSLEADYPIDLTVIAPALYAIESRDMVELEHAMLLGPCRVINHEYANITCRALDIVRPDSAHGSMRLAQQIIAECLAQATEPVVAYRGHVRWVQTGEPVVLPASADDQSRLRDGGTYLITGGLSQAGLSLAEYLAQTIRARLILVGSAELPAVADWDAWLASHDEQDSTSQTLRRLQALEQGGAELHLAAVMPYQIDQLQTAITGAVQEWGGLDGLFVVMPEPPVDLRVPLDSLDQLRYRQYMQASSAELELIGRIVQDGGARFCLLLAGLAAMQGGTGLGAAATADCFAQAFVQQQAAIQPAPWIAMYWDIRAPGLTSDQTQLPEAVISLAEGGAILQRAAAASTGTMLIVSAEGSGAATDLHPTATDQASVSGVQQHDEPHSDQERALIAIWQRLLGVDEIGIHDSFFNLGGHSLLAPQLLSQIQDAFAVELPLSILFERPTVASLSEIISAVLRDGADVVFSGTNVLDLRAEAILDPTIDATGLPPASLDEPTSILLTGATGFLGAFLLRELLERTSAQVYCLVRASNANDGKQRLMRSLDAYQLWDERLAPRISAVIGDLAQPRWAMTEQQFQQLAARVDVIYHCGAWVNFTYPYSALKPTNVLGFQETLRLASQIRVKPVHYISSVAVFSPVGYASEHVIEEDRALDYATGFFSGYAETKWVAEQMIGQARERGIPVTIYRPGVIGGHSQSGVGNTKDLIWNLMKGCIQLGIVPDVDNVPDLDTMIDVAPVDYVSQAIVTLSQQPSMAGQTFHLANPERVHWGEVAEFLRGFGYTLRQVTEAEWQEALVSIVSRDPDNALYPFLPLLLGAGVVTDHTPHVATDLVFDSRKTRAGLASTSISCPPLDARLLTTYFNFFIQSNFLQAPAQRQSAVTAP